MKVEILNLLDTDKSLTDKVVALMQKGFKGITNSWDNEEDAKNEVQSFLDPEKITLIALDQKQEVVGLIGALKLSYPGNVWELHPIVVDVKARRKRIGETLLKRLESCVKKKGGKTLWLGADDEHSLTSISGKDVYPDILENLKMIKNNGGHAMSFYKKMGFSIAGILPDANGFGKPDIFFAKRIQ